MPLLELISAQISGNFEKTFFFVLSFFVMGRYGYIFVEQAYAVELKAVTDYLLFGSPWNLYIDTASFWNEVPYLYETTPEDDPESF